jgi:hypothetical protein
LRCDLAALIFSPYLTFDLIGFTRLIFVNHPALAPRRVTDKVKTAHLHVEASKEAIVSEWIAAAGWRR